MMICPMKYWRARIRPLLPLITEHNLVNQGHIRCIRIHKNNKNTASACLSNRINNIILNNKINVRYSSSSSSATPVYRHALQYSERIAVTDINRSYTYGQMYNYARQLSAKIGPKPGVNIAFLAPNTGDYIAVQWAIWMCGAVAVPLCKSHPLTSHRYYIDDSHAGLVVVTKELRHLLDELELSNFLVVDEDSVGDHVDESVDCLMSVDDPAMILYTSGTTGPPKGVVLTHSNLEHQVQCLLTAWKWSQNDSLLHVLPLHHTHGIVNCLLCPLTVGASIVMMDSFRPGAAWDLLTSGKINLFMAVPTIYAILLDNLPTNIQSEQLREKCQTNLRLMVSGSAALPSPVLTRWRYVTGHTLLERYGMTEIGMALSNPLEGERRPGCVGHPLPGVEVQIVRWGEGGEWDLLAKGDSSTVEPSNSDEGELLVRGPNVFREYLNKPEATAKEFTKEGGWFKTGDTSKVEDGVFRILGRSSVDIIKSGGYKISALDVERVLLSHPNVSDVAVVGLEDDKWGQVVAAVIVLRSSDSLMDGDNLKLWADDKMPKYWIPNKLKIVDQMPRNAMGKVNKKELVKKMFV